MYLPPIDPDATRLMEEVTNLLDATAHAIPEFENRITRGIDGHQRFFYAWRLADLSNLGNADGSTLMDMALARPHMDDIASVIARALAGYATSPLTSDLQLVSDVNLLIRLCAVTRVINESIGERGDTWKGYFAIATLYWMWRGVRLMHDYFIRTISGRTIENTNVPMDTYSRRDPDDESEGSEVIPGTPVDDDNSDREDVSEEARRARPRPRRS